MLGIADGAEDDDADEPWDGGAVITALVAAGDGIGLES